MTTPFAASKEPGYGVPPKRKRGRPYLNGETYGERLVDGLDANDYVENAKANKQRADVALEEFAHKEKISRRSLDTFRRDAVLFKEDLRSMQLASLKKLSQTS